MSARIDAEGPGPLGRSENAISKTSHLLGLEQKKPRVGQGCGQGTQATGLKNRRSEEHSKEQQWELHIALLLQSTN